MKLEITLGMTDWDVSSAGWRGTDQGTQMKTSYGWYDGGNGTNSSGFSGLPGGEREAWDGYLNHGIGNYGIWWRSSADEGNTSMRREIAASEEQVYRGAASRKFGYSVRCIRHAK